MLKLLLGAILATVAVAAEPATLALTHVAVIDGSGARAQPDLTVVTGGDRITSMGKKVRVPRGARVVNARGKFLIPGLWDMHAHVVGWGKQIGPALYVANGVTGIRDMGEGDAETIFAWRKEIMAGSLIGPRIVAAGLMVDGPTPYPMRITVKNPAEARDAVNSLKKRGADFIKVHYHLSRDSYFAVADESRKLGLSFAGHVPPDVPAREASDAGQKSIEHLNESQLLIDCSSEEAGLRAGKGGLQQYLDTYDAQKCQALFELFRRNGTWQTPTLVTLRALAYLDEIDPFSYPRGKYVNRDVKVFWHEMIDTSLKPRSQQDWAVSKKVFLKDLEVVAAMRRAGVELLAGTDAGIPSIYPGFSVHDELTLLVEAGLSPMEALQTATRNPAKFLGQLDSLGTIQAGKVADLVLLDANPLDDIRNTRKISAVIANGKLIAQPELRAMLASAEAAAAAGRPAEK